VPVLWLAGASVSTNGSRRRTLAELEALALAQMARGPYEPPEAEEAPPRQKDPPEPEEATQGLGRVRLTPASEIPIARTRWLWDGRIAIGTFALLAGREGLGKSTVGYWIAARVTRGELAGEFAGQPHAVLICATEDTYAEVIIPRLIAAGADLSQVYRVDVVHEEGTIGELSLPTDLTAVAREALAHQVALLLLDPLISRLGRVDTHRDSETRQALEPLSSIAGITGMAVLGLIHHNKSTGADALTQVMGSRAFTAVARSVHTVVEDPDDENHVRKLFGTVKNNLGPIGLPTLSFTIEELVVGQDPKDQTDVPGSRVVWGADATTSIAEAMAISRDGAGSQMVEAVTVLRDLLDHEGGCVTSKRAKAAGRTEGISEATMKRAAVRMGLLIESSGYPRTTTWTDPESVSRLD
jgi:hypothetical protein